MSALDHVVVEGPDARPFLQGQLSQDVDAVAVGDSAWSFLLEPDGHVIALLRVRRTADDSYRLEVDAGVGARVEARLRKFLLRTKADISVVEAADNGVDEAVRINEGRPGVLDIDERTVPAETGWVAEAVSFTKGCYTGQELVARMDSRVAEPPRRLVRVSGPASLTVGAPIAIDGADVGRITSAAPSADGAIALGYVKRGARTDGAAEAGGVAVELLGPVGA